MGKKGADAKKKGKGPAAPLELPWPLTRADVGPLLRGLAEGRLPPPEWAERLLKEAAKRMAELPNVVDVQVAGKETVTVVGDTHGQFQDLLEILQANGYPTRHNRYVFNGDFVDRGEDGCGIVLALCAFHLLDPATAVLLRGNHETEATTTLYGFQKEVRTKFGTPMYGAFLTLFHALPLAARLNHKVLVVHGGLWRSPATPLAVGTLEDLTAINRVQEPPFEHCAFTDVLWSDPHPQGDSGLHPNRRRGCGLYFGPDVLAAFLAAEGLRLLVRSHEGPDCAPLPLGHRTSEDECCITVFSARRYMGQYDNQGAYLRFDASMVPRPASF